jgi:uncharacterized protein with von Willebrand factor type A (vWA) domain
MPPTSTSLPLNVMQFARILRCAGLPIGPDKVITSLEALQVIDIGNRADVFWALHAVFVKRHAHSELFRLAFDRLWTLPELAAAEISVDEPTKPHAIEPEATPQPRRMDDVFGKSPLRAETIPYANEDIAVSWSAAEQLRGQDFETMSAAEWAEAKRLIVNLRLPIPEVITRRFRRAHSGSRIDMRATMRAMVRSGGLIDLHRKRPVKRHPPLVVLCDISGSMSAYSRMLLHFIHAITNDRYRVHTFLFGTRLTNVSRHMAHRDPDDAVARISKAVDDWSGGTRIGATLGRFNRLWSRRVLGQGAVVLLISDGLDRDGGEGLAAEMRRLHHSCRRLIWLNPLLRYDRFEPKSVGIRAMLPHVDDFRPVHNLDSLAGLVSALSDHTKTPISSYKSLVA